jgi:lactoylglutathione lyase
MPNAAGVSEPRLVVTAAEYVVAVACYRDTLGLPELETYTHDGGHVTILDAGRATLEINDPAYAAYIDDIEVCQRVAGHLRFAVGVHDSAAMTERLTAAGAELVAPPTRTP